ncbi:cytochrome b/b6 domain-containing protein [Demequina sp. NBRC 110056]|uniref:cytochrome b/b6 domain-containing protein n=1 Tax=Demequina sp. NBRC 110056 TaxID=1570345 RepID=UPI001F333C74|nr:cytochrome b/b6 domain-containing protein [Demequina sp. NBRC 110056]
MTRQLRRGLPRVAGGEPWPPAAAAREQSGGASEGSAGAGPATASALKAAPASGDAVLEPGGAALPALGSGGRAPTADRVEVALRRGLPREAGGDPWPPEGTAMARVSAAAVPASVGVERRAESSADPIADAIAPPVGAPSAEPGAASGGPTPSIADPIAEPSAQSSAQPSAQPSPAAPAPTPRWVVLTRIGVLAAVALAALVLLARWLMTVPGVADFVASYPGAAPMPEDAPVGIPPWLSWTHLFNVFLMVTIVRTGLLVRTQQRPEAYWAPREDPRARISLMAWTHQAVDVLWIVNGVVYVALLFATGQWMRIVPTSWEVVPNALSSVLQYLSLEWPAEDGWVHYNGLQQLAYFTTVFIAAPLAIATGVRMSLAWRSGPRRDRIYPLEWARRLHFPVMIYFVAFVVGHVALVLATGAQENLNHIYAARTGGGWLGFALFVASTVVIAGAAIALRPLLVAPVARRFGNVSGR